MMRTVSNDGLLWLIKVVMVPACRLKRVLLHAFSVELQHPITKAPLRLVAPLPKDMLATARHIANVKEEADPDEADRKAAVLQALAKGRDAW